MRLRRKNGSAFVESALIWPLIVIVTALFLSHGLEETALVREAAEIHKTERAERIFRMPETVLSLSSLVFSSGVFSSAYSE